MSTRKHGTPEWNVERPASAVPVRSRAASKPALEGVIEYSGTYTGKKTKPSQNAPRELGWLGVQRYVAVVAVLLVIVGGAVLLAQREVPPSASPAAWRPLPARDPEGIDESEALFVEHAPVRIRNEFDRNEVFEFPAGTTQQQAREEVAKILMHRALERQSSAQPTSR